MHSLVKKIACVFIAASLAVSMIGCGSKKEDQALVEDAENVMEALFSRRKSDLKDCGYFSGTTMDKINMYLKNDEVDSVMDKARFEVDESSIERYKDQTYCDVEIKIPDHDKIVITLEFEKEKDGYQLTNGDEVIDELYSPIIDDIE